MYQTSITSCIQLVNGYINYLKTSKKDFVKEDGSSYTINDSTDND